MQIVELPRDIVYSTKNIQFSLMVIDSVTVSDIGYLSVIFHFVEFVVTETESPSIVQSTSLAFSTENVDISLVCCDCAANSGTGNICITD